jgi:hypothetical protein
MSVKFLYPYYCWFVFSYSAGRCDSWFGSDRVTRHVVWCQRNSHRLEERVDASSEVVD